MPLVDKRAGFTLIEVLIAMAISAIIAFLSYSSISRVMDGIDGLRATTDRSYDINRAMMILSRDIREFVPRPIRDEYGEVEPALTGGTQSRFILSFTRTGWHNPLGHPRSNLQRVNYRIEDGALWRDAYVVLDRTTDTEPRSVRLLEDVDELQVRFLETLDKLSKKNGEMTVETGDWVDNWVALPGASASGENLLSPPVALQVQMTLLDWGEMERIYVLPPL